MKKAFALLLTLLLAFPAQGCWNYQEVESMLIVTGLAVDRGIEGYKYRLSFESADTANASPDKPVETTLLVSEGDSLIEAIRSVSDHTGMRLYFHNCQVVVIGRDVAEDSILPIMDFIARNNEFRQTTELFVSEEKTAGEILRQKPATIPNASFEIDKTYELNEMREPVSPYFVLYENYNTMASRGRALALAAIRLEELDGGKTAALDGMAVFRGDRLMGFLDAKTAKFAMFVMDKVHGGVLNVRSPAGNVISGLEILSNHTTVIPIVQNGSVRFAVHTQTEATAEENAAGVAFLDEEHRNGFQAAAEGQLRNEIVRSIQAVQQMGLDVFGFGDVLHRSDPGAWYAMEKDWGQVFRTLKVDVSCRILIRNSATKIRPARIGDRP